MADKSKLTPDKWIISYTIVVMYDNFFLEALSRIRKKLYKLVFLKKIRKSIQGPLITDGRNSNEWLFFKRAFGRMTLASPR